VAAAGGSGRCCWKEGPTVNASNCNLDDPDELIDICAVYDQEVATRDTTVSDYRNNILSSSERTAFDDAFDNIANQNHRTKDAVDHKIDLIFSAEVARLGAQAALANSFLEDLGTKSLSAFLIQPYDVDSDPDDEEWKWVWQLKSEYGGNTVDAIGALDLDTDNATVNPWLKCEGSLEAESGDALKNTMIGIFDAATCTFELELPDELDRAPASGDYTTVEMIVPDGGGGNYTVDVPYFQDNGGRANLAEKMKNIGLHNKQNCTGAPNGRSPYCDDGWFFTGPARDRVRLTRDLCELVQDGSVSRVDTQVCDTCAKVGQSCVVECTAGGASQQICFPLFLGLGGSTTICFPLPTVICQNGTLTGRCEAGVYQCIDGEDVCIQDFNPMPEICNGVDDDCDGEIDNFSNNEGEWFTNTNVAWYDHTDGNGDWDFEEIQFDGVDDDGDGTIDEPDENGAYAGMDCYGAGSCSCPTDNNGVVPDPIFGSSADADEFQEFMRGHYLYLQSNEDHCTCGAGLEEGSAVPVPASFDESTYAPSGPSQSPVDEGPVATDGRAACATSPARPGRSTGGVALLALALLAGWRRRRRGR
jgi:MYXO-CTERM domain-containing protein